jgi:hypothetical protein
MIGKKTLSTIRNELEMALASKGADPIQELDRQIAFAKRKGESAEVMEGLKRLLQSPNKPKHRKPGVAARKTLKRK